MEREGHTVLQIFTIKQMLPSAAMADLYKKKKKKVDLTVV